MALISSILPFVRVANHYRFPVEQNQDEVSRVGYCYAFHLVDSGKGKVISAGRTYHIKKGDLIYVPPGVSHSFYSESDKPLSTFNLYCELWENQPLATSHHLVWHEDDYNTDLLTRMIPCPELDELPVVISLMYHSNLMSEFTQTVIQHGKKERYTDLIVSGLVKILLMQLVQIVQMNRPMDYRIMSIIERIDKEAKKSYRYEDWLTECGLRKTQFHELFKQATGMSPKVYWTRAIMKQAQAALWESNRTVTDIATDLGYSSIHHFTKQFTLHHGVSPLEFRRRKEFY